jgi:hypothetical protein
MKDKTEKPKTTIIYYGKKVYCLNPLIAQKKLPKKDTPEFLYEDIEVGNKRIE